MDTFLEARDELELKEELSFFNYFLTDSEF